jgi:hypothetical protein
MHKSQGQITGGNANIAYIIIAQDAIGAEHRLCLPSGLWSGLRSAIDQSCRGFSSLARNIACSTVTVRSALVRSMTASVRLPSRSIVA